MVAKITTPESLHRALYYNENKVKEKDAECIYAGNFLQVAAELNLVEKKERFDQLTSLNRGVKAHTLHVSLNFAPGENLSKERLIDIAAEYMDRIGFGDQPFLVYQHRDAGHPHMHIVSTSILSDGNSIGMNFIGRDKSNPARKAIEEKYRLVRAEGRKKNVGEAIKPIAPEKLQYGRSETKRAITNGLQYVLGNYRYRSLPELNAILKLYNLRADPGQPGSRMNKHGGLVYQILDEKGQGIGVPIKASSIFFKPGLQYLGEKFQTNKKLPPDAVRRVLAIVDATLRGRPKGWQQFVKALRRQQIHPVPYLNEHGTCYGLSFVDLDGKLIIKASELGKGYSATAILQALGLGPSGRPLSDGPGSKDRKPAPSNAPFLHAAIHQQIQERTDLEQGLNILFHNEEQLKLPFELNQEKKKKKKNKTRHL